MRYRVYLFETILLITKTKSGTPVTRNSLLIEHVLPLNQLTIVVGTAVEVGVRMCGVGMCGVGGVGIGVWGGWIIE